MGEEADPEWVILTQQTLGELIKRPKLTGALLQKPPFRFLHDIVSEVTKVTGFASGLYQEDELQSAKIKVCARVAPMLALRSRAQCCSLAPSSAPSPQHHDPLSQRAGQGCEDGLPGQDHQVRGAFAWHLDAPQGRQGCRRSRGREHQHVLAVPAPGSDDGARLVGRRLAGACRDAVSHVSSRCGARGACTAAATSRVQARAVELHGARADRDGRT